MSQREGSCISHLKKGFTLVELLVSISIMTIILGITLSGGPQSIMRLSLSDNVYQGELMLREAQLQGSAVNSVAGLYGGVGVFIDLATSSELLKFRDRVDDTIQRAIGIGNGLYDSGPIDEKELVFKMSNNHKIGNLCVATGINPFVCSDVNPTIKTLTVSFSRPKQTAHIYINGNTTTEYSSACIQFDSLKSPEPGFVRSVLIYHSGMISKNPGTCQ